MAKLLVTAAALALSTALVGCVDVAGVPSLGSHTAYERGIDQDANTRFDEGPTTRNLTPGIPADWR